MNKPLPNAKLLSVINHVILPPRVPAGEDCGAVINQELLKRLIEAAQSIRDHTSSKCLLEWEQLLSGLKASQALNSEDHLDKATLLDRLRALSPGTFLILHVLNQNAGVLVYRQAWYIVAPCSSKLFQSFRLIGSSGTIASEVVFEVFEASPSCADVLASENALKWEFPGPTVAVPYSKFINESFQESLATFLERASSESISEFASKTTKAESRTIEARDTVDPALVSQFLVTILAAIGRQVDQPTFHKRIRDDVSWADGSKLPWRRSPFWLVLRVSIQSRLHNVNGLNPGRFQYKLLIAVVVAQLLRDATGVLEPGLIALLKAKLGRRLAKLAILNQHILDNPSNHHDHHHHHLFQALGSFFERTMKLSTEYVDSRWSAFKKRNRRLIPRLPSLADDNDMVLSMPSSGPHLDCVMAWNAQLYSMPRIFGSVNVPNGYDRYGSNAGQTGTFTNRYFALAQFEEVLDDRYRQRLESTSIQQIATDIGRYLRRASTAYDSDPEQKSTMILCMMRIWCQMDQMAADEYPLILKYHPGFPSKMLDALHLTSLENMKTLQKVQEYLQRRYHLSRSTTTTIFDDPSPECFAVRYFDSLPDSSHLHTLLSTLEATAERDRSAKEREWNEITSEVESLENDIDAETCLLTTTSDGEEHIRLCRRCFLKRKRKRMCIKIFEYPLPSNVPQKKALVFELDPPSGFCLYRATTWAILHFLEQDGQRKRNRSHILLSASTFLNSYLKSPSRVSLASTTKLFEKTHYSELKLPVPLNMVCIPCGLTLKYFDMEECLWIVPKSNALTITHHLRIPAPLRALLSLSDDLDVEASLATNQLSSYDVMATQSYCPAGLSPHEFIALNQALSAGDEQRWFNLLIELGSSNLNFSTEAVRVLLDTLSSRAGGAYENNPLRKAHRVFRDSGFCDRLAQLVRQKLDSISSNWREGDCMDVLITLILRMCSWSSEPQDLSRAYEILQTSRNTTYHWVTTLSAEINTSTDVESVRKLDSYIFTATLLYRRTFSTLSPAFDLNNPKRLIDSQELSRWIEVSIIFRSNMPAEPDTLPVVLRNALVSVWC